MFSGATLKRRKLAKASVMLALACLAVLLVPAAQAFAAGTGTVEIEGAGSGEVVNGTGNKGFFAGAFNMGSPPMACSYASPGPATGTCSNSLVVDEGGIEAEEFKAVASPGSAFLEWQVIEGINAFGSTETCKPAAEGVSELEESEGGGYSCLVFNETVEGGAPNGPVKVKAVFAPAVALSVFVSGKGTVSSFGLTCANAEECTGEYVEGGGVTLKEKAEAGYAFAGWLGCKHTGPETCTVTMTEAKEVTAAFVKEGSEGPTGASGESPTITPLSVGDAHCPAGGFEVTFKSNTEYLCDGKEGATGATGKQGEQGEPGLEGKAGAAGKEGAAGKAGANGAAGPQGPAGAPGPAGRDAKVTCSVKQPKGKKKKKAKKVSVTCKVQLVAAASSARVHWSLTHGRHLVRHGFSGRRLKLAGLKAGRYELHVQGQKRATAITVG